MLQRIVVIGVGGGGCNAVDRMIASNTDVEYIADKYRSGSLKQIKRNKENRYRCKTY